jgi:hypothetical protein
MNDYGLSVTGWLCVCTSTSIHTTECMYVCPCISTCNATTTPNRPTHTQSKLDSDLFELMKRKTQATSLDISRDGSKLAIVAKDGHVRVLDLRRGRLLRVYNEGLEVFEAAQATGTLGIDSIDFGRYVRVACQGMRGCVAAGGRWIRGSDG